MLERKCKVNDAIQEAIDTLLECSDALRGYGVAMGTLADRAEEVANALEQVRD
jgi:hypothetical protein